MTERTAPISRAITTVWKTQPRRNSSIHSAAQLLDPDKWAEHDPFLFLQEDWFQQGTFDVHPHRGIETVTYVIDGKLQHYDNKFGNGELGPGDVQWMTAGRGVIHKEDPAPGELVHSLQLWVNLPRVHKMTEPRYQNLRSQDMSVRHEGGASVRIFSGSSGSVKAATQNYVPVTMVEMLVSPGVTIHQDLPTDYNGFMYVLQGKGTFGVKSTGGSAGEVLWMGRPTLGTSQEFMSEVKVTAIEPLRVLLYAGRPLGEPVVAYGPFVMNTREEIQQAFIDYQTGKFGQ